MDESCTVTCKKEDKENWFFVSLNSNQVSIITSYFQGKMVKIAVTSRKKGEQPYCKNNRLPTSENRDSLLCNVPRDMNGKMYYRENDKGVQTRLHEHRQEVRHHFMSTALMNHSDKDDIFPDGIRMKSCTMGWVRRQGRPWNGHIIILSLKKGLRR